ncbi:translational machinery component [Choiromyces venosus 120613-1]|uniref:Translational machinery component n=1 Tax=Choiromyces venosus 120613-1 TaxID=1336337 RepID=A0A3N4JAV5_9PEZI|nr:translational machinery component [Choiromyces venosus 120613-1]
MSLRIPPLLRKGLHIRLPRPTLPAQINHQSIPHHRTAILPPMTKPTTPTPTLSSSTPTTTTPPTSSTTTPTPTRTSPIPFTADPLLLGGDYPTFSDSTSASTSSADMYHLHVYSPRHNCHITFTRPNGDCIISKSTGNVGIKGAARGSFDAAFQLASHMLGKMAEMKNEVPRNVELSLRDFGPGREAFLKALMGREGQFLRGSIRRVTDSTRVKFGGTRSPALRRL